MKKSLRFGLLLTGLFIVAAFQNAVSSHLMGGNLGYEYLGVNANGLYQYRITITIYRYCEPGSSNLPTTMNLGVYRDNPTNPTGNKQLITTSSIPLISITPITPPNGNDTCTFTPSVCVEEGVYQGIVTLASNTTGYYFISDRCCRNNNIANLNNPGNTGQAYYAYAPPPSTVNSSPTFAVAPVPFLCASDTVSILNQAYDPDGDLLVYNFVTPYQGISSNNQPNPNPPANYTWPIPNVNYAPGYSQANPFGAGGFTSIDTLTGLASYYAPNIGFYVLAVEIREYRNGVLIGVSRRDLQIIVIACPINPAPFLTSGSQTNFIIKEGQTLCFSSTFSDSNGDSLFLSHTGDIFNPAITNPPATFTDNSGLGTVTGTFCWTPSCDQGRSTPYQFSVSVTDNGCPAKITNVVYSITVVNTPTPASITGPDTVCFSPGTAYSYTVPASLGNTFSWTTTNANLAGNPTGTTAGVSFPNSGQAIISVSTVNQYGCHSDTLNYPVEVVPLTVTLTNTGTTPITVNYVLTISESGCIDTDTVQVTVNPLPAVNAGPDKQVCENGTVSIGTAAVAGQTYNWTPSTNLNNANIASPTVSAVGLTAPATLQYILLGQNTFGCQRLDTVNVTVNDVPVSNAGLDLNFCSGASGAIGGSATTGFTYSWSPATGLSSSTSSNPTVTLTNNTTSPVTQTYVVTTTLGSCSSTDTVQVIVRPNPISNAGANQLLCSGSTTQIGSNPTAGYTYSWSPSTGLNNTTISNPTVTLTNNGTTTTTATYIVTTNLNGCTSSDTVLVTSAPQPTADAGPDVSICSGQSIAIGTAGTTGYAYSWSPSTGLSNTGSAITNVTLTNPGTTPTNSTYIVNVNAFGCTDADTVVVEVRPAPVSNAGANQLLCSGSTVQIGSNPTTGYAYSWSPASGLNNTTISNPTVTLTNNGTTTTTATYVVTTTLNGCNTTDTVVVTSAPQPTANAGPDAIICSGQTANLGAAGTAGYTYSWTPSIGLSSSSTATTTATLTNNGTAPITNNYVVTVNAFGCLDTDTVSVEVRPAPISEAGANQLLCAGSSVQIGTAPTPGYTYSWSPPTGLNDPTISNPTVTLNNTGTTPTTVTYAVTTTLNGCSTVDSVTITSGPQPTANAGPDVFICSGQSISIGTPGTIGYTYSWTPSTGLSNTSAAVTNVTGTNTGTSPINNSYIISVNAFGCIDADTVVVQVRPNPVSDAGQNQLLCAGSTVQLGTSSTTGYTYSWSPATGLNNTTISNPTLTLNNTGTTPTTATYIVTTTLNGCVTSDTVVVTSAPQPTANAGPDVFICSGQSISIGTPGTTGYTYSWTPSTGLSNANSAVTNATGTNTGTTPVNNTYIVNVNAFGCIDADTVVVQVRPNPIAQAGPDAVLCGGDTLVLGTSATPGYTYAWSPTNGLNSGSSSNPSLIVSNTGSNPSSQTYTVTTTLNGCTTLDSVTITINPQPVVLANGNPLNICSGDTTQLIASGASSYVWTWLNNTNVISLNDTINVHPATTQSYVVTGSNGFGCSNSDTITVTVSPIPTILATASNDTICSGDTLLLTGAGGTTYTWSVLGGSVVSTSNPTTVAPNTNTTYVLTGTSVDGCASTDTVSVVVNPGATAASILGNLSVCPGVTGVSYWIPNANPNSTYTWSVNGGIIASGQGTDSILVNWSSNSGVGTVTVIETTVDGCQTPTPITLNVTINILLTPAAPTGPQTLCANQAQGIVYTALNTPGSTYTWTAVGGTIVGGQGTNSVTVDWTVQGPQTVYLYYDENSVTATNVCFGTSDSIAVTINPSPNTSAVTGDIDVCIGESGSYGVTSTNGSSYSWNIIGGNLTSGNGTSTINSSFPQAGNATISVVETNSFGCPGDTVVLAVIVHELPLANAGPDQSICIGQTVQLNASGGTSYQWSPATALNNTSINNPVASPSATTNYIVQVTDQYGCKNNDTVQVAVNPLPNITVTPASSICIGGSIPLNATGGTTFAWTPSGSLSNANSSSPTASPSASTVYTVVVTDQNGCVDSANVSITVNPLPVATASGDTTICDGSSVSLVATGGTSYSWSPATGLNNSNISNPVATPVSPITYTVTVTDQNGCTDTEDVTIALNDVPVASFTVDENVTTATCDGIEAALINTSQNATNYYWTFPDGSTSTDENPSVSLGLSGTTITLVAQNNICYDTLTVNYNGPLLDVLFANLVNVFTPNGDGKNDCFELGANFKFDGCSAILILNRWGQPVFTSGPGKYCWNGRKENSGEELPAGTYYLTVTIAGSSYKGTITLIR